MTLDEAIKRYTDNAEYERIHGSLQGCLDFRQLAEWLKELKELKEQSVSFQQINESAKFAISATGQSDSYCLGMCNGIEWMRGTLTNTKCNFFHREVTE